MTAYDERSGYKERLEKAEAEIARLTEENAELKEFDLTKPDAQWREIYDDQLKRTGFFSGQLSEAKAEIARLTYERDVWKSKAEYYGRSKERVALTAEIARLREWKTAAENLIAAIRLDSGIAYPWPALDLAEAALKPDTGE